MTDKENIAYLEDLLETERMRLAACGVAAMQNTAGAVKDRMTKDNPYWSASYSDVCRAVDREIHLESLLAEAKSVCMNVRAMLANELPSPGTVDSIDALKRIINRLNTAGPRKIHAVVDVDCCKARVGSREEEQWKAWANMWSDPTHKGTLIIYKPEETND